MSPADSTEHPPTDEVVVTVTTDRTDRPDGLREAQARGTFEAALHDALAQRCEQWALEQVLSGVLSRRPARGEPAHWFDSFSSTRTIRVLVLPTAGPGAATPPKKVQRIPGLFIPARLQAAAEAQA